MPFVFLLTSCLAQSNRGIDQTVTVPVVQKVLSDAQQSGSLEYWGVCDVGKTRPAELANLRTVSGKKGSALGILEELFADDAKMQITQEDNGNIRMVETDVPSDFLDIRIHRLSFPSDVHSGAMALVTVLHTPEVMDFMTRNIGSKTAWDGWGMTGQIVTYGANIPGELNDVTVAQALDYVLHTFPGFWTYQNCHTPEGGRKISVGFTSIYQTVKLR